MTALRLELEISAVDPSGDMVFVEARGPGGVQVGLMVAAASFPVKVGQRLSVALETPTSAAPSMRERMGRSASSATANTAPPATTRTTDQSDLVLSAILGSSPSAERERDVEDEMDALLGRRPGR